ncbi:MAG: hypothetical protein HN712_14280 [Gemmatimonadetes bacterium]|jgi:fibronectin type 3 domain-containing protein|nr:hypothetical protein [Gemmatimonadota bacterium]MBT6147348.1 hypothetical protein [Gemmatimonadota bacterium]MBT7861486.1 hypothetical protein [Gemmatimonadota bacterium]
MTLGRIGAIGALCLAMIAISCDRDRSNPLDPQSELVADLPATPAQIGAEAGVGVIRLAWQAVTDKDLAGYAIYRANQSNGTYSFVVGDGDSTAQITTGKTVFTDTVGQSATFFYRVAAVDTIGLRGELSAFAGATALEDAVAPGAPQSLSAVPDEETIGRVTLRWSAPQRDSNGGELSGLIGYAILRAQEGAGGLAPIDTVSAETRQYVDEGLKSLTGYTYSVLAFDEIGNASGAATLVQVRTSGLPTPSGLSVSDEIGRVILTWQAVDDATLIGYDVYRSDRSDAGYVRLTGGEGGDFTTGRTAFTDSTLSGGELRFYRVRAVGTDGQSSELSAFVSGEADADETAPGAPRSLSAVADEASSQVTVRWGAPPSDVDGGDLTGLSGFVLLRAEGVGGSLLPVDTLAAEVRDYVDTGLKALTQYTYALLAFDEVGNQGPQSSTTPTTTAGVPRPMSVRATGGGGRITLSWSPVDDSDLAGYDIYRSTQSDGDYTLLAGAEGSELTTGRTTYVDSNLIGGSLLYYKVQAVDANGLRSEMSVFAGAEASADIPRPSSVRATGGIGRITLSWSPVDDSDLAGYDIYRATRADGDYTRLSGTEGSELTTGRTAYVDSNLAGGSLLYYKVQAVDANGLRSEMSVFAGAEATADEAAPGVPRNIAAVADEENPEQITLGWSAPLTDADGGDLTGLSGFIILRTEGDGEAFVPVDTLSADLRRLVDSGLKSLTSYTYAVVAFDADGNESAQARSNVTRTAGLPVPAALRATDDVGRILLSWQSVDDSDLAGYDVYRSTTSDGEYVALSGADGDGFTTGRTSYIDSNLAGGTLLFYKVQAVGSNSLRSELSSFASGEAEADESAPGQPRNVSAVADEDDSGQITVGWNVPATDAGGDALTGLAGYVLLRAEGADGALILVDSLAADAREYADTGLRALTDYRYALFAFDAAGNEGAQALSNLTRTSGLPTPVGLSAADGIQRITVNWRAIDDEALAGYDLFRASTSDGTYQRLTGSEGTSFTTGLTTFVDSGLTAGDLYYYKVQAIGDNGLTSGLSGFAGGETLSDESSPGRPQNTSAVASQTDATAVSVRWTAPTTDANGGDLSGLDGFRVLRAEANGSLATVATLGATDRQFDDSGLRSLTRYTYAVIAFDATGNESQQSSTASTTTIGVTPPSGLAAEEGTERVTLTWADVDENDLIGYNVYRSAQPDDGYVHLSGDGGTGYTTGRTSFIDSTISAGSLVYYRVSTVTDGLESERSGFVSAIAVADTIATPAAIAANGGITRITVAWSAAEADDLAGYNVYRSTTSDGSYSRLTGIEGTAFTTGQTSFIDSGLVGGQIFFYRVSVVSGNGESDLSEFSGATVQSDTRPPSAPTFVEGQALTDDPEKLTLTWTAPTTDSSGDELTGVASYTIYRSDTATGSFAEVGTSTMASFQDSGLVAKTTYYYEIEALDEAGNVGPRSSVIAAVTGGVGVPANVRLVSTTPSSASSPPVVTISWEGSTGAIIRYEVQRTQVANSSSDADYTSILPNSLQRSRTDNTVTRGQTYYYRVRAVDLESRESDWTDPLQIDVSN